MTHTPGHDLYRERVYPTPRWMAAFPVVWSGAVGGIVISSGRPLLAASFVLAAVLLIWAWGMLGILVTVDGSALRVGGGRWASGPYSGRVTIPAEEIIGVDASDAVIVRASNNAGDLTKSGVVVRAADGRIHVIRSKRPYELAGAIAALMAAAQRP